MKTLFFQKSTLLFFGFALLSCCPIQAQKWPASQLQGATFQMPERLEKILLPDSIQVVQWQDSFILFQALAVHAPEAAAVTAANIQAFYANMVSQVEEVFGLRNMSADIGSSSEVRIDGLPGRSTSGSYVNPTTGLSAFYRYDMAISGDILYVFTCMQLGPQYDRERSMKFFDSVKLPDDPRLQAFGMDNLMEDNAGTQTIEQRFAFLLDPRLLVGLGIVLLIGVLILFQRRQEG